MDYDDRLFPAVGDATRTAKGRQAVECSCGRMARLELDGERYVAGNPFWKFRKTDEREEGTNRLLAWGWYCGEVGHEQKS